MQADSNHNPKDRHDFDDSYGFPGHKRRRRPTASAATISWRRRPLLVHMVAAFLLLQALLLQGPIVKAAVMEDRLTTFDNMIPAPNPVGKNQTTGVRYPAGIPFTFRYIYIIGARCGVSDDWMSRWSDAGRQVLNVTEVICFEEPLQLINHREFWLASLARIAAAVGEYLDQTLVVTVALGLETDWTPVADYLRQGMAFFHAKEDPHNFDITQFGLQPEDVLYFYFQWDEFAAAENIGKEVCRLFKGTRQLKVSKSYTAGRNGGQNYRVDLSYEAFRKECPDIEIIELWTIESDIPVENLEALLSFNRVPDICFMCEDSQAFTYIEAAKKVLTQDQFRGIGVTGWDYIHRDLLKDRKILATVDQEVHYPDKGLWKVIGQVVAIIEGHGLTNSKAVQEKLKLGDTLVIQSDALMVSSDGVGFLMDKLLDGYNSAAPPSAEIAVSTGLYDVTITKMTPFDGVFSVVLWLRMAWYDPRLTWHSSQYSQDLSINPEDIWIPPLFYKNKNSQEELYQGPAIVNSNGTVTLSTNIQAGFLCSTTLDLRGYPFDIYDCSIDVAAPANIFLDSRFGFDVLDCDPNFDVSSSIAESDEEGESVIYFQVRFERKPFTGWVRMIIPGLLINLVGFMAFWIPSAEESIALGVTALLCSLTFRETVDIPETSGVTWAEVFMMINIAYQAAVMFIIWVSYSHNRLMARTLDLFCSYIHPKNVANELSKSTVNFHASMMAESAVAGITYDKYLSRPSNDLPAVPVNPLHRPLPVREQAPWMSQPHVIHEEHEDDDSTGSSSSAGDTQDLTTITDGMFGSGRRMSTMGVSTRGGMNKMGVSTRGILKTGVSTRGILKTGPSTRELNKLTGPSFSGGLNVQQQHQSGVSFRRNAFFKKTSNDDSEREDEEIDLDWDGLLRPTNEHEKLFIVEQKESMKADHDNAAAKKNANNKHAPDDDDESETENYTISNQPHNVDWIGRWLIVPSYFIVMGTLLFTGMGFSSPE